MSADIIQFRDYQKPALAKATTLVGFITALTGELPARFAASEQSHYHNLAEPILDTAPSEWTPPEAS